LRSATILTLCVTLLSKPIAERRVKTKPARRAP
jgi:hypothetical protein